MDGCAEGGSFQGKHVLSYLVMNPDTPRHVSRGPVRAPVGRKDRGDFGMVGGLPLSAPDASLSVRVVAARTAPLTDADAAGEETAVHPRCHDI